MSTVGPLLVASALRLEVAGAIMPPETDEEVAADAYAVELLRVADDYGYVRVFFDAGAGSMRPGKRGLACRVGLPPELADALTSALQKARDLGLIDRGGDTR